MQTILRKMLGIFFDVYINKLLLKKNQFLFLVASIKHFVVKITNVK